jgi:hypothetical protein
MLGVDLDTTERAFFPREGADPNDEFEQSFEDEGVLPDAAKAHEVWSRSSAELSQAQRICHGRDVSQPTAAPWLEQVDYETRWWQLVRARFWRVADVSIRTLEAFPAR